MGNVRLVTSSAMGKGGQLIAVVKENIEYICDTREQTAKVRIGQVQTDLTLFDYQVNAAATMRIRDYDPQVFACNDAVNTNFNVPAGQYVADIFTATSGNTEKGTVAITSGQKELYSDGDVITVTATPKSNYVFAGWSDGSMANPYSYTFGGGVVNLVAQFEAEDSSSSN